MTNYKLSPEAEADLIRIHHQWGVRNFGETQADSYFYGLIKQFKIIAVSTKKLLKSWRSLDSSI